MAPRTFRLPKEADDKRVKKMRDEVLVCRMTRTHKVDELHAKTRYERYRFPDGDRMKIILWCERCKSNVYFWVDYSTQKRIGGRGYNLVDGYSVEKGTGQLDPMEARREFYRRRFAKNGVPELVRT